MHRSERDLATDRPSMTRLAPLTTFAAVLVVVLLHGAPGWAAYGDSDYDCGVPATLDEYTQGEMENVAYSADNSLYHYAGLESLGSLIRNNLTFWVPGSFASWATNNPAYNDREYLAVFSAGAQGVGALGVGGRPNVTTGQRDGWSSGFGGGADRMYRDVCNRGLYGRIRDDPYQRFPSASTMFVVNFDNRYLWTDEPASVENVVAGWVTYIKSLAAPERLKGVYLSGASMGGGLMAEVTARLNSSTDGWELVPVIVQGMDPVLGKNRLGTIHPVTGAASVDNYSSPDPEHYFYRTNPSSSTTFYNAFPLKNKIRMNTIIGGGVVVGGYDTRAYSYVQSLPAPNDYDLTWLRQTSVDLDHAVIGRNWNAPIVAGTGTVDSYRAMDHWRDSYTELDMRGEPVYYLMVDSSSGGPGSHGVEHDWGDIQTSGSAFHTSPTRSPVVLHETLDGSTHTVTAYRDPTTHADRLISFRVTAPTYALGDTAVYGTDYTIVGYGPMPAEGHEFFILPGETQTSFVVETLYQGAVETDEHIYLEIEDGQYVGVPGNVQRGILMRIVDHNYDASPESCAAAGLLYDPISGNCLGTCAPELPDLPCATLPSKPYLDLIATVEMLALGPNVETGLTATAQRALTANLGGQLFASRDELIGFIGQVGALSRNEIAEEDADALIVSADAIIGLLNDEAAAIPSLSDHGLIILALLSVAVGTIVISRREVLKAGGV